jgi:redox-sensitive bicupin YhaK (pirin superfamily)
VTVELDIQSRPRDLGGGLRVRRLLPAMERRMVGPFIFFDHMGPVTLEPGQGIDVRPHPHIGLSTVTYLFDGEFLHRDSLGTEQPIRPGAVNWMTAGKGIVHSERSPLAARKSGPSIHGLQLWVALPDAYEDTEPSFAHHAADSIPETELPGARMRVIAGSAFGVDSPVKVHSELFYSEVFLERNRQLTVPDHVRERGLYVVDGQITIEGKAYGPTAMLVFQPKSAVVIHAAENARFMLFGGAPVGERHIEWNFVASSPQKIEAAKKRWTEQAFAKIPGDSEEFIPLPR